MRIWLWFTGWLVCLSFACCCPSEIFRMENIVEPSDRILNSTVVYCPRCPCIIYRPLTAFSTKGEFPLPIIARKSELLQHGDSFPRQMETEFWTVKNMTDFENVGFCFAVDNIKYLICADCEIGPLGYHDMKTATEGKPLFHICASRVRTSLIPKEKDGENLVTEPETSPVNVPAS
nr:RAB interacting factor [Hymenolepis microstoma]